MCLNEFKKIIWDNLNTLISLAAAFFALYQGVQAKNQVTEMKKQNYPWLQIEPKFKEPFRTKSKGVFDQENIEDMKGFLTLESADCSIHIKLPICRNIKVSSIYITIKNNGVGNAYNLIFYKFNKVKINSNDFIEVIKNDEFRQIQFIIEHDIAGLPKICHLWFSYETITNKKFKQCIKLQIEQNEFLSLQKVEITKSKRKIL